MCVIWMCVQPAELATALHSCALLGHPLKSSWLQAFVSTAQQRLAEVLGSAAAAAAAAEADPKTEADAETGAFVGRDDAAAGSSGDDESSSSGSSSSSSNVCVLTTTLPLLLEAIAR
jgi:hypothetical protein